MPSNRTLRILFATDSDETVASVLQTLRAGGYTPVPRPAGSESEVRDALAETDWDLVVSAHRTPALSYAMVLRGLDAAGLDTPLIIVADSIGEESAVEAIKAGAHDYVRTDRLQRLVPAVERELRAREIRRAKRSAEQLLRYQANHDDLTGLLNRRAFQERLQDALLGARRTRRTSALCFMDLDRFKVVNDTCGHRGGDELLRQLADLLRQQVRETDALARLGGDEFALLLRDCDTTAAEQVARGLHYRLARFRFHWLDQSFDLGMSIGIVGVTDSGASAAGLLGAADLACYAAKGLGGERIRVYQPEDAEAGYRRGELHSLPALHAAIEREAFALVAQPLVGLHDGSVTVLGREVLLRMRTREGVVVEPAAFLPMAERNGLMGFIDRWVIETVIRRLGEWLRAGLASEAELLFINLSAATLEDPETHAFVGGLLTQHGVPGHMLCFETTETSAVVNLSAATGLAQRMKALGCRFALDNFGSGLSSFSYLKGLPLDFVKIDGRFVRDMLVDPMDRAVVESVQRIGHVIGLRTVAEFVETPAHLAAIRSLGFDAAQGFAIGAEHRFDAPLATRTASALPLH